MLAAWPISPNPVTSVAARTPWRAATAAGMRLRVAIERVDAATEATGAWPALSAVAMMPVPSGLVSTSWSPARPAAFVRMWSGSTRPVIA